MREVIYTFLDQELQNTRLFRSEAFGVAFPFTAINVSSLAKALYEKFSGFDVPEGLEASENPRKNIEIIMSSFLLPRGGHQFGYAELAIHEVIKKSPQALQDISEGKEPENSTTYTFGSPTNELGEMNEKFLDDLDQNALNKMGELYGEAIAKALESVQSNNETTVTLTGVSMGASMAAEAGDYLMKNKFVHQSPNEEQTTPRLMVKMYVPAAMNDSILSKPQIKTGYIAEGIRLFLTDPGARSVTFNDKQFVNEMYKALPDEIEPRMQAGQDEMKKTGIKKIIGKVSSGGYQVPEGLKVNTIIGINDPLMYSPKRKQAFNEQKEGHSGSIGETLIPDDNENTRTFGAETAHRIPFFRENEWKRWDKLAELLQLLKNR